MASELPVPQSTVSLTKVRVVLCDTQEPGNIGAAARAMKTMGLGQLYLVRPREFPHGDAWRLAVSAGDLLDGASVHQDLAEVTVDCHTVFGISARQRRIPLPLLSPRQLGPQALACAAAGPVALVFGGEEAGLDNADMALCDSLVSIPSHPDCRSLNLAAAVQLICYELRLAQLDAGTSRKARTGAPRQAFEGWLAALDAALADGGYYHNKNRELALEALRRSLQRAAFDRAELQMLHGVLRALRAAPPAADQT
ncbi:MAG: RNA methyltransferase [Lysobacterales bacterium]